LLDSSWRRYCSGEIIMKIGWRSLVGWPCKRMIYCTTVFLTNGDQ